MRYNYYQAVEKLKAVRLKSTMSWAYECIGAVLSGCTRDTLEILNDYERVYVESKNFKRKFDFELEIRARLCRVFEAIENGESVREYGEIVTAWVERKKAETALATETAQAETIADETPAVEVEPAQDKISKTAEKYLASEMTADEVEAELNQADAETLREFAVQREIPIDDNEDRAGMVKILMEELVCEKLGVYDTDPADKEICTELEEAEQEEQPTALVFEVGKTYFTHPPLGRISKDYTVISRTAKTILFRDEYGYTYRKKITNSKHTEALSIEGAFISARNITTRAKAITEPEQPAPVIEAVKEETPAPVEVCIRFESLCGLRHLVAYVESIDSTVPYIRKFRKKELKELTAEEWSRVELNDLMRLGEPYLRRINAPKHEIERVRAEISRKYEGE